MLTPLFCLALAWNPPSAADVVSRRYDLGDLLLGHAPVQVATLPLREGPDDAFSSLEEGEPYVIFPEQVVEFVVQLVGPDEWQYEGRSIEVGADGRMEVVAPPNVHDQVERIVDFVLRVVATPVTVRADVFRVRDAGALRLLDAGDATTRRLEESVAAGALSRDASFRLSLSSGVPVLRTRLRTASYLRDFDVEIAEAATVLQPVMDAYATGVAAAFRADRALDGELLLQFALRDAWLEELLAEPIDLRARIASETRVDSLAERGVLQSPRVAFVALAGACRLREGETALAMATSAEPGPEGSGVVLALTLEALPAVPRSLTVGSRTLVLREAGGDAAFGFAFDGVVPTTLRWPPAARVGGEPFLPSLPLLPRNQEGMEPFHRLLDRVAFLHEGDETLQFDVRGTFLQYLGPKDAVQAADAALAALPTGSTRRTVTCRGGDAFAASVPAAVGEAVVVCGTQETYVSDYDVDVASRVSIANPQVDAGTSAYVFHVRAGRGTDRVRATLSTHFRDGGRRPYDADSEEISTLHQPRFLVAKASAALSDGKAALGAFAVTAEEDVDVTVESSP